jgi:hypothetical protein
VTGGTIAATQKNATAAVNVARIIAAIHITLSLLRGEQIGRIVQL